MKRFQEKIGFDKEGNYKAISDNLYKSETFTILGDNESDLSNNTISTSAQMAKAIIGKHINECIEFNDIKITINSIEKI